MATPHKRRFALAVIAALACSGAGVATADADAAARHYPDKCNPVSVNPAINSFNPGDAWRFGKEYKFPFKGWTSRGQSQTLWKLISGSMIRKATYPAPNLPTCRVGRFGTEDRGTKKAGSYFAMLQPIDGVYSYTLRDTFDRPVTTLQYFKDPPVKYHPSKWGWFIDGKWAGHDATRAFEVQSKACKLAALPAGWTDPKTGLPATESRWIRDPNFVMIAFNPALGSPGKGFKPNKTSNLRVRAFVDRRAVPQALLARAERYDFGCGETKRSPWQDGGTLAQYTFNSYFGPGRQYMRGYYFGEGATTLDVKPGEARLYNNMPYSNYNARPQFHHATYAMIATTGVAGGGMVRGIVRSTVDRFQLYDEMRYCDPNYTLRNMQIRKGKKHYKKSKYFAPETYSKKNRAAVRWVFGRFDPDPSSLTEVQAAASRNPASEQLYAWLPIYCDK